MGSFLDYVNSQKKKDKKYGSYEKHYKEKKIGLDTLESDLTSASDFITRAYGGWQPADTMDGYKYHITSMRDRLGLLKDYRNKYNDGTDLTEFNTGMDKLISTYDAALSGWNELAGVYGNYADADSYNVAKRNYDLSQKYTGLSFDDVHKAMKDNPDDVDFLSRYALNVGYADKNDLEREFNQVKYNIENSTGAEKQSWQSYYNDLMSVYGNRDKGLFKGTSVFDDGYQPGDILDAVASTGVDLLSEGVRGIARGFEGMGDFALGLVSRGADVVGLDSVSDAINRYTDKPLTENLYNAYRNTDFGSSVFDNSFAGQMSADVANVIGQIMLLKQIGGAGQAAYGAESHIPSLMANGALFASAAGNSRSEARAAGATDLEADIYGFLSGGVEVLSEMAFGGLGKTVNALGFSRGISSLDDAFAKKVGNKIGNFYLRNAAELGIEAGFEGVEELMAGFGNAVAKKLTYMSDEDLMDIIADENLLDQFIVGTLSSAVLQSPDLVRSYGYGTDFVTGKTRGEEKFIQAEFAERVLASEKDGKTLSVKEKNELYKQVEADVAKVKKEVADRKRKVQMEEERIFSRMQSMKTGAENIDNATGKKIRIEGISQDEKGATVLKTSEGVKSLNDVTLTSNDANVIAIAETMEPTHADLFVSMYEGGDVDAYKTSFDLAYSYGKNAYGVENAVNKKGILTEQQAIQAYKLGLSERSSSQQKQIDEITQKHFADGGVVTAGHFDDSKVNYKKLNSRQKAAVSFAKMLSQKTGINIVFFESTADEDGIRKAENGRYEPKTNTIYIDAYAGLNGELVEDAIIPTMAHELTHWMKEKAPEAYAKLSEIVMDTLSRDAGASPETLVALEKIRNANKGRNVNSEYAQDELIARACEDMLSGNKTANDIIAQMDDATAKSFSKKLKETIAKIRAWLRDLLKVYKSGSEEAKILRKYDDKLAQLQKAWDEGFESAIRANQAIKTNESGETRYSFSSIASSFFGDENMSTYDFLSGGYKKTEGYRTYVEQCVNNMRQTRDISESAARAEVEKSIAGIVDVAIAAKKAGYDIYDDAEKRSKKDSKDRLLFSSLEPNSDYFTSSDISTICDKRQNFAEIYEDIVRAEEKLGVPEDKRFFNNVDNYFVIHQILAEKGLTQPCRQCYVESMRKNLTPMANAFLKLIRETNPNNKYNDQLFHQSGKSKGELKTNNATLRERVLEQLEAYGMSARKINLKTLTTEEGLAQLKIQAPLIYEAFNSFYGQSKPKMPKAATPFRFGELAALLTDNNGKINARLVRKINHTGGFRLQSYSDFQIKNFVDVLQVIFEAGTLGLNGHAYTKVPAFLDATENTNLKRNISIFMYNDGGEWKLDRNDSFPYALDEIYDIVNNDKSGNTSIIAVSQNAEMSAWIMANNNVGYGIPFHKSGLKMGVVRDTIVKDNGREVKGYSKTKDHTKQQTEVWAKTNGDNKALTKVKKGIDIYEFWDFENKANLSKNKLIEKNLKAYINACDAAGYLPKFREYVMNNSKVLSDVLRFAKELGFASADATIDDISFKYKGYQIPYGYYKFLGDFGMFTPDGKAAPQQILSLKDYKFDKAVKFFEDGETLRRNELLQQFSNGEKREEYRESNLSTEELEKVIKSKRIEVVDEIVGGRKYSDRDSDGNRLTKEQIALFESSKMRDENGSLKVMYHGTNSASFTVFDASNSDDGISFFFTDKLSVASGYSGSYEEYAPKPAPETASGLNEYLDDKDDFEVIREDGEFKLIRKEDGYVFFSTSSNKEMYEHILNEWADFDVYGARNYKVYLNIKNPLVVDAKGREWNDIPLSKTKGIDRYNYIYVTGNGGTYNVEWEDMLSQYGEAESAEMSIDDIREKFGEYVAKGVENGRKDFESVTIDSKTKELIPRNTRQYAYYAKANGYDGVIINNVVDMANGTSFSESESSTVAVVFDSNQIKSVANTNPTSHPDIRYADRQNESIYDSVGELKRLQKENEKLKADTERLRKKNRLERTVTSGRVLNENHIAAVAGRVLNLANSRYNKADLTSDLKRLYEYLQGEGVAWNEYETLATDVVNRVLAEAKERKVTNDYAKSILSTIRNTKISLNDTQKAEAEYAYGKNWNRSYFGRVTVANDGIPLESVWSEWATQYPDVFDANISDADMATALLDIYDSTKAASEIAETYNKAEAVRDLVFEIYQQFWNVSPVRTLADKHDKEVKRLKFEHRQAMKELREKKDAEVFETQWHYSKLIHKVRKERDEKIARIKAENNEYTKQYREKLERRSQIAQITKKSLKLNKWLKNNSKDEHIVDELKAPVAAVLRALDFSSERLLGTGVPTQKDISLQKAFDHLYKSMSEIEKRQGEEDYSIDMPVDYVEFLEGIKDKIDAIVAKVGDNEFVLRDMTLEELQDMNKMISVLSHIVTSANKALADANGKAISFLAQSTMNYTSYLGEKSSKVGAISDFFNFDNGLPVYVFKMMGEGGQQIFRNMQNGWDKMAFNIKRVVDYSEKSYSAKEVKEWSKEVHTFEFSDGSKVQMTTAQIMSLYCLQKRDQARQHLVAGGMRVADFKVGTNKITNEDGALLLPHEIDKVISTLTNRQKEVADALQEFMNTVCSEWGNEVSMKRFGIKSFGEENYFPIQSDSSVVTGDDTPKSDRGSEVFRLLNMDFTKALNPNANNRIVVDNIFDVFATHTSDMAKYNAIALPVLDMFRWYNYKESYRINPDDPEDKRKRTKSLKQSLKKAYGDGSTKYIMQFMKDLNGAHSGGLTGNEKFAKKLISAVKTSAVGANLRVAFLQPVSYLRASAVIDSKYLTAALAHKPNVQKAKDTCGIALWKSMGFYDTNISRGVTSLIKHDERWYQKAKEYSMKLAEWGDAITWGYLYNACEAEINDKQPGLTGKAKDDAIANRLRDVIYATQVVDSTMTRTQTMRNPSTHNQMMTSFMSEPSISYNMLHDLYISYNADRRQSGKGVAIKKNGKKIARVTAAYFVTLCASSLVGGLVDSLRDDDEDEKLMDAMIDNATESALSDVLGMLPVLRDVVSIYKGFNVGRMDMQGIQSSYYLYRKLYKAIMEGEWDYKTVYSIITSALKTGSQISGLPVSNAYRDVIAIWNNSIGEVYESLKVKEK